MNELEIVLHRHSRGVGTRTCAIDSVDRVYCGRVLPSHTFLTHSINFRYLHCFPHSSLHHSPYRLSVHPRQTRVPFCITVITTWMIQIRPTHPNIRAKLFSSRQFAKKTEILVLKWPAGAPQCSFIPFLAIAELLSSVPSSQALYS